MDPLSVLIASGVTLFVAMLAAALWLLRKADDPEYDPWGDP